MQAIVVLPRHPRLPTSVNLLGVNNTQEQDGQERTASGSSSTAAAKQNPLGLRASRMARYFSNRLGKRSCAGAHVE